jgi:peptidylprolyl isomerase
MQALIKAGVALLAAVLFTTVAHAASPENTLVIELKNDKSAVVEIELLPKLAPGHVERIKKLARAKFYDGIVFHRVIPGFMAQTGDPDGNGTGGSDMPDLKAEFSGYTYKRGTVGAARTANPDSANSQFFICFDDSGCAHLTGQYTVWGQVISGMEHVDKITGPSDRMWKVYLKSEPR